MLYICHMNKDQVLSLVRQVLAFVGGIVVIKGFQSEEATQQVIGAIMGAIPIVWGYITHNKA